MDDWIKLVLELLPVPIILVVGALYTLDRELNDDERKRVGAVLWGHAVERSVPTIIAGTVDWTRNRLVGGTPLQSIGRALLFTTALNSLGFALGIGLLGGGRRDVSGAALTFVVVLACTAVPDVVSVHKTFWCVDRFRNAKTLLGKVAWICADLALTVALAVVAVHLVSSAMAELNAAEVLVEKVQPAMLRTRAAMHDLDEVLAGNPDLAEARRRLAPALRELDSLPSHAYPEPLEELLRARRPPLEAALTPTIVTSLAVTLIYVLAVLVVLASGLARMGLRPIGWLRPTSFVERRPATAFALVIIVYVGVPYAVLRAILSI